MGVCWVSRSFQFLLFSIFTLLFNLEPKLGIHIHHVNNALKRVGIPGVNAQNMKNKSGRSSNGCISCKSRRVKCDEVHPNCQRCQKAGITCKGYNQLKYIDERPRLEQAVAIARAQEEDHAALQKSSYSKSMYHTSSLDKLQRRSIPSEISLLGFKNHMLISFLVRKLSEDRPSYSGRDLALEKGSWIEVIPARSNSALSALAAIIFGQAQYSLSIVEEGRRSYGKAISDLRLNLLDSSKISSFETLATVTALCMYEVSHSNAGERGLF